ncbi:MAG: 2-oxoacid:acceptor oxidoreductase family protein [Eubacteriales bacterium]|jgi:2-oxoglutarate ferredoxin oxidoreductase subunit gamma|nr:2-oxoacid:acceptor oxidoreductase family protein [Eubacteriales bacterium]MDD3289496.1 2-oxoacid:acceptor oxidoreductase family protein [Eubacteriales bacterium]MDD3863458.1 2-oxoacid:acceptor oxidoreductase family protein [Eubacteriales bacterium]MDD4444691.1 2-oxoacid:acceptor oxidoreductase family protein [Eubacteriales bacterium]
MTEMICAGFGGQGVLTAGMLLIHAGMKQGNNVIFYPSYGSEMRGGTANCAIKISEKKIASPVIRQADIVFTMNAPAIDKFESILKPGGLLLVNSSLVDENRTYRDDIRVVKAPVTDIAADLGNPRGANIAMIGVLAAATDLFDPEFLLAQINDYFEAKGKKIPANEACFRKGMETAQ